MNPITQLKLKNEFLLDSQSYVTNLAHIPLSIQTPSNSQHFNATQSIKNNNSIQTLIAALTSCPNPSIQLFQHEINNQTNESQFNFHSKIPLHHKLDRPITSISFHNSFNDYNQLLLSQNQLEIYPLLLTTSSEDGTVVQTDLRDPMNSFLKFRHPRKISIHSSTSCNSIIATGDSEGGIQLFEQRMNNKKPIFDLTEFHTDIITQLHFHPFQQKILLSSSHDNLLCLIDTSIKPSSSSLTSSSTSNTRINHSMIQSDNDDEITSDDMCISVCNTDSDVIRCGWFGGEATHVYAQSSIETLSLWDIKSATRVATYQNIRQETSQQCNSLLNINHSCDYLVNCHYEYSSQRLYSCLGNNNGALSFNHLNQKSSQLTAITTTLNQNDLNAVDEKDVNVKPVQESIEIYENSIQSNQQSSSIQSSDELKSLNLRSSLESLSGHTATIRDCIWLEKDFITSAEDGKLCRYSIQ